MTIEPPDEQLQAAADQQPILGLPEIADLLDVDRYTPARWNERGVLPRFACRVSRVTPVWMRPAIIEWAFATKRLPARHFWELPERVHAEAVSRLQAAQPPQDGQPVPE